MNNNNEISVQYRERAKQFVNATITCLNGSGGSLDVANDEVRFRVNVGLRQYGVRCWFDPRSSRAHISALLVELFPPALRDELAAHMKQADAILLGIGAELVLGDDGSVEWSAFCQVKPTTPVDGTLVKEVLLVGLQEFKRLTDLILEFVVGRMCSTDIAAFPRFTVNSQSAQDEPSN